MNVFRAQVTNSSVDITTRGNPTDKNLKKVFSACLGSAINFIHKDPDKKQRIIAEYKKNISIKKLQPSRAVIIEKR